MGESRRKKERKAPIKPTEKLDPIPVSSDPIVAEKQKDFCKSLVERVLNDDQCLSFSKPVEELWDRSVLEDYFEMITKPMDVGTVSKRVSSTYRQKGTDLFDPNPFREEFRLVFLNAIQYNNKSSELSRLASKFIHLIDDEMEKIPLPVEENRASEAKTGRLENNKSSSQGSISSPSTSQKKVPPKSTTIGISDDEDRHGGAIDGDDGKLKVDNKPSRTNDLKSKKSEKSTLKSGKDMNSPLDADLNTNPVKKGDEFIQAKKGEEKDGTSNVRMDGDGDSTSKSEDFEDEESAHGGEHEKHVGDENIDDAGDSNDDSQKSSERERLVHEIDVLGKQCASAYGRIAEIELEKNVPLSHNENAKLRDEVEALSWEMSQKVIDILHEYVNEALKNSHESDPEYVTLEFSTVEPRLLREIEGLIHPDPRLEKEKAFLEIAERDLDAAKRKLKRLTDGSLSERSKKRLKQSHQK